MIDGSSAPETAIHMGQARVDLHEGNATIASSQGREEFPNPDISMMQLQAMREEEQHKMEEANAALEAVRARGPLEESTINTTPIPTTTPDQIISTPNKQPIKKTWDWSDLDIRKFMKDFAVKMKLDKVASGVKNIFQTVINAAGKWWDVSSPKIDPPTRTGTLTTA